MRTLLELVGLACVVAACIVGGLPVVLLSAGVLLIVLANRAG